MALCEENVGSCDPQRMSSGGEGKTTAQYVAALVGQATRHLAQRNPANAIDCLMRGQSFPHNLGEGKLYGAQENHIFYWLGCAHELLGDDAQATAHFEAAALGLSEPTSAVYYNDQPPDMIFYQGLARRKLGQEAEAAEIFQKLIDYGQTHLADEVSIDYFAVSLPDFLVFDEDLNLRNRIHCHYMMGLGYLGLAENDGEAREKASEQLQAVWTLRRDHLGAAVHYRLFVEFTHSR